MASSEDIQTLILTTLDTQGAIENTDSLKAANGSPIPYLAVVGVLNSLGSKEVLYNTQLIHACHHEPFLATILRHNPSEQSLRDQSQCIQVLTP